MKVNIIRTPCRFNMEIPQHKRVYEILMKLDSKVCKSKNQFMIDAMEYYIDNLGKETFVTEEERKSPYVTRDELAALEEQMRVKVMTEARTELMRMIGVMWASSKSGVMAFEITDDMKQVENNTESIAENNNDEEDDEVLADLAAKWMG